MDEYHIVHYFGIWGWQIIALIFLVGSLIMVALPLAPVTIGLTIAMALMFMFCESMVFRRRRQFLNETAE